MLADRPGDGGEFRALGERAGDRTAVRQHMTGQAVRGEADRAFLDGVADQFGDLADLVFRRLAVDGAFAHDVEARGAVADEADDVDGGIQLLDGVEVFAIGDPVPGQAVQDRVLRNVLDGLHHAGQEVAVGGLAGREGDAAVAEQGGGHAMPGDWREQRIPAGLGVEVGVQVHETGRDGVALRVDFLAAPAGDLTDSGDRVAVDGDIAMGRLVAEPVDDEPVADGEIVSHGVPLLALENARLCHAGPRRSGRGARVFGAGRPTGRSTRPRRFPCPGSFDLTNHHPQLRHRVPVVRGQGQPVVRPQHELMSSPGVGAIEVELAEAPDEYATLDGGPLAQELAPSSGRRPKARGSGLLALPRGRRARHHREYLTRGAWPFVCVTISPRMVGATLVVAHVAARHEFETGRDKPVPYSDSVSFCIPSPSSASAVRRMKRSQPMQKSRTPRST